MSKTALYRHFDADGALLYVGISTKPVIRHSLHKSVAPWFERIARIDIEWFDLRSDAAKAEVIAIRDERPEFNVLPPHAPRFQSPLGDYLKSQDITVSAFCDAHGFTYSCARGWANGRVFPSHRTREAIEAATDGGVPVSAWSA